MKRNNLTADKLYLFQPISELAGFSYLIMCYAMKLIFIQTWVDVVRSDVILALIDRFLVEGVFCHILVERKYNFKNLSFWLQYIICSFLKIRFFTFLL